MMEDVQFYAMMGVEILGYVLAVAAIVAIAEKVFGRNKGPNRPA